MNATEEQLNVVRKFLRDMVRSQPLIQFHKHEIYEPFPTSFRASLGSAEMPDTEFRAILREGAKAAEAECPALHVGMGSPHNDTLYGMHVGAKGSGDWTEIQAWAFGTDDASRCLSPSAAELLTRVEEGDIGGEFISELSVRRRINLYGFSGRLDRIIEEIRVKRGIKLKVEEKGERWIKKKHLLKITLESREDPVTVAKGLNAVIPNEIVNTPDAKRKFRRWFARLLLDAPFEGAELEHLWKIESRKEYFRCFPWLAGKANPSAQQLIEWFETVQHSGSFGVGWNFDGNAGTWTVVARPAKSWEETKQKLREELGRKTAEEEFGLTSAAAALFDWIRSIPAEKLELGLTSIVEEAVAGRQLLLQSPWEKENFPLFLRLLCDEINARTAINLEPVRWMKQGNAVARILVRDGRAATER